MRIARSLCQCIGITQIPSFAYAQTMLGKLQAPVGEYLWTSVVPHGFVMDLLSPYPHLAIALYSAAIEQGIM